MIRPGRITAALAAAAMSAGLLTGCQAEPGASPPLASVPPTTVQEAYSPDQAATLATLRKVDDHPLWTMTYRGGYDRLKGTRPGTMPTFGCSLFTAHGDPANPLFARNFDFAHQPALLLFTSPPDGHASISMVDVSYIGVRSEAQFTTDEGKRKLLDAYLLPFDGMNAKGLTVGMATVPSAQPTVRADRRTVGSVRILRLVLDSAATVDEAIAVFDKYNVDMSDSPPLHYMFADAAGGSAILEFVDGKLVVHRQQGPSQIMVNFRFTGSDERSRANDSRHRTAEEALKAAGGKLTPAQAMDLLSKVKQSHTQWSVVYGQKTGEVRLTTGKRYGTVHEFKLPMR